MTDRRRILALGALGATALLASSRSALAADCPPAGRAEAIGAALLDRYVAAANARDTSVFPQLFTETYIQHSGRSPSGLAAQVETFRGIFARMPDLKLSAEDRIIGGDKVVARMAFAATHTQPLQGVAPTGKPFVLRTIDIWRVENGKFAEHWDLTDAGEVIGKLRAD